jgi:hypothetical protein
MRRIKVDFGSKGTVVLFWMLDSAGATQLRRVDRGSEPRLDPAHGVPCGAQPNATEPLSGQEQRSERHYRHSGHKG